VKLEAEDPDDALRWPECKQFYKTSLEKWWCRCPSYQKSPYHICKHLIREYMGEDGILSNKPRQPQYGEAWRQSCYPILWLKGIHSESLLVERDLRTDSAPPILPDEFETAVPRRALLLDIPQPEEDPIWDPSDEDYSSDQVDSEAGDDRNLDSDEMESHDSGNNSDSGLSNDVFDDDSWEDTFAPLGMEDGETADEFMEREYRGQQKLEALEAVRADVNVLLDYLDEVGRYPASHRHIEEIPLDLKGLMNCAKRSQALRNGTTLKSTWSPTRRGNMFID
jgi:hypothetical protein